MAGLVNKTGCLLVVALALGGCVTQVETIEQPHPEPAPAEVQAKLDNDPRVAVDPALRNVIRVVRIKSTPATSGFLKVQVNVQNMTDSVQNFSYRMDWFEADGTSLPLASVVPQQWTLLRKETSFLAATAPTPSASDFKVTFFGLTK